MGPNDGSQTGSPVTEEQFMQAGAIFLGIMAGDRFQPDVTAMPGASWEDPEHPMHTMTGDVANADAG